MTFIDTNFLFQSFFFFLSFLFIFSSFCVISCKNPIHSLLFLVVSFFCAATLVLSMKAEFIAFIFIIIYVGAIAVLFLFCIMMVNIKLVEVNQTFIRSLPINIFIVFSIFFTIIMFLDNNFLLVNYSIKDLMCFIIPINSSSVNFCNWDLFNLYISFKSLNISLESFAYFFSFLFDESLSISNLSLYKLDLNNILINRFVTNSNTKILGEFLYTFGFLWLILSGLVLLVSMIGAIVLTLNSRFGLRRQVYFNQFARSYKSTILLKK